MRFSGKFYKDGKFWLAEIPILDLMTQGRTKKEAYEMVADMLETIVNQEGFNIKVYKGKNDSFEVGSSESKYMISLLLQRKRERSGLSVSQLTESLGMAQHNSYSRYEQGKSPSGDGVINRRYSPKTPLFFPLLPLSLWQK